MRSGLGSGVDTDLAETLAFTLSKKASPQEGFKHRNYMT